MKIRPAGAALFYSDRQTDMTKLIVAFRYFANASKNIIILSPYVCFFGGISKFSNFLKINCKIALVDGSSVVIRLAINKIRLKIPFRRHYSELYSKQYNNKNYWYYSSILHRVLT